MPLNENIKKARLKNNIKQSELGDMLGVGNTTISGWEHGDHNPDINHIVPICNILNVDPNYLFDYNENEKVSLKSMLKNKNLIENIDDYSDDELELLLKFAMANKNYILKK